MRNCITLGLIGLFMLTAGTASATRVATFDDLGLGVEDNYHGEDSAGSFTSGPATFSNNFDTLYGTWDGFAASTVSNNAIGGFGNQYSAITGGGQLSSDAYGVSFWSSFAADDPTISFTSTEEILGLYVTNTSWAYYSMLLGDSFAKQFGGVSGDDEDWFLLTIDGFASGGAHAGTVDFYLADYRFEDNSQDYLVDEWAFVDLSLFGEVESISFSLSSSDNGVYGMNTPAYFALDSVTVVPEPATAALVGLALAGLGAARRRSPSQ